MKLAHLAGWLGVAWAMSACAGHRAPPPLPRGISVSLPKLVSTEELARWQLGGPVLLLDVRTDVFAYLKGHLPGAEYLNTETVRASEGGIPTRLLPDRTYRELFARLGVNFTRPVVIYSAGESRNIDATFVAWLLAGLGHPYVALLDGGFFKWQLEQRPVVQPYPRVPQAPVSQRTFMPEAASLEDVRRGMTQGSLLVDARPPDQYAGTAGAQMRHGHIPGAINHYWQDDLTQEGFGHVWKPLAELRTAYAAQGITPDQDIITYCNSATEASHVYFTLRYLLGYPRVRIYVGSWTEWAEDATLPVETGIK